MKVFPEVQRIAALLSFEDPYLITNDTDIFKGLGFDEGDYFAFVEHLEGKFKIKFEPIWQLTRKPVIKEFVEYIEQKLKT